MADNKTIRSSRRFRLLQLFVIRPRPLTHSWKVIGTGTVIRVKFTEWYCSQIANLMIIFNRRVRVLLNSNTLKVARSRSRLPRPGSHPEPAGRGQETNYVLLA